MVRLVVATTRGLRYKPGRLKVRHLGEGQGSMKHGLRCLLRNLSAKAIPVEPWLAKTPHLAVIKAEHRGIVKPWHAVEHP
jgi:hypothetical protein